MAESERPSPSDREGDTPEDPALSATASADPIPDDDSDLDAALLELAAAPAVSPRSRRALRPEPGSMIAGSYRIERQLGEGGMGTVYLARDLELDRWVALKLQSRRNATNDLARLQREAKAMARLSHPNVVVVHEVGTHEGQVFIAMEYVEGGTAREWIERRPDWRAAVEMLIGAGRGLAAAHEVGIVHRDFKPENVMIDADERVRVMDFGLARSDGEEPSTPGPPPECGQEIVSSLSAPLTVAGAVMGTPAYMAPSSTSGWPAITAAISSATA